MTSPDEFEVAPQRLRDQDGSVGLLIREALSSTPEGRGPSIATLQAARKGRRARSFALGAGALASAAALLFWLRAPQGVAIFAEDTRWNTYAMDSTPEEVRSQSTLQVEQRSKETSASSTQADAKVRPVEGEPLSDSRAKSTREPTFTQRAPTQVVENEVGRTGLTPSDSLIKRCAELAQAGQYESASSCYGSVSRSGGASAELAQLEQVRVLDRALGQPLAALASLETYTQRFPQGALRGEAALTKIGLLASTGQKKRLVKEVDQLLFSNWVPERKAELHLIKAEVLVEEGQCSAGLQAAQASEEAGGALKRIFRLRKQCAQGGE